MSSPSEFLKDADSLLETLAKKGAFLCDRADLYERKSNEDRTYYGYLKSFLVHDGILCREMMTAIQKGDLILLVMSAARVVLEDLINIAYLAAHPKLEERISIAVDWLERSNDSNKFISMLDAKSVFYRAKAAGKQFQAIYENEYAALCDYVHGGAQRSYLNLGTNYRVLAGQKAINAGLNAYSNIVIIVSAPLNLPKEQNSKVVELVSKFQEKYKLTVAEATID